MFQHSDPAGTDLLARENALPAYRMEVDRFDTSFGRLADSSYAPLEAFLDLAPGEQLKVDPITWIAFPRTANNPNSQIDSNRFALQDEYVEWRVERNAGKVIRITFTTEFPEYYQALAMVGADALIRGIQAVLPGANPTNAELFGPNFNPGSALPEARSRTFLNHSQRNPWNNGEKGILCLGQGANTMGALFNLVGRCAVVRSDIPPTEVCGAVGGACGPARNSDPRVCQASQLLARGERGLALQDPVGIRILRLEGIWKINGQQVDINDPQANRGAWAIGRNGRRAVLDVSKGVKIGDDEITSGAQVAAVLTVGASVISARDTDLPAWARTGQESTRA